MLRIIPAILQLHQANSQWFSIAYFLLKTLRPVRHSHSNGKLDLGAFFADLRLPQKPSSEYVHHKVVLDSFHRSTSTFCIMPPKKRPAPTKQKVEQEAEPKTEDAVSTKSKKTKITNGDGEDGEKKQITKRKQKKEAEPEVENIEETNDEKISVRRGKRNIKENPETNDDTQAKKVKVASKKKTEANSDEKPKKAEKVVKQPKAQKADTEESVPKKRGGKKTKETENTENGKQDTKQTKKMVKAKDTENDNEPKQAKKRGKTPVEPEIAEQIDEPAAKQRRGKKAKEIVQEDDDSDQEPEPPKKVGRKKEKPEKEATKQSKSKKTKEDTQDTLETDDKKNKTITDWKTINFSSEKVNDEGKSANFKITSWNVDGLRAWLRKDGMNILSHDSPDILCLQETKCADDDLPEEITNVEGYKSYWSESGKKGYAGVAILTKQEPIKVTYGINDEIQDEDGRCITAEFEHFFLVCVYVPNAGRKLVTLDKRLDWNEKFKTFIKELDETKPVIVCGDMNVAHNEIDLKNPKSNKKNAGFTQEERDGMTDFLEGGFADTFRTLYPEKEDVYTFWTYMMNSRKKNIGWRLDYFLVSNRFKEKVCDNVVFDQVFGSDHCPLTLFINI